ncbi:MAG: hypothetical protein HYY01_00125 [Chloroflexi bacterium]|nr:hypothetical protein [Chloroflexota bacterium]
MALTTSEKYPYLKVRCRVRHWGAETWALVDTGFDGYLVLPREVGRQLGPADSIHRWGLADGARVATPSYYGLVDVVGIGEFSSKVTVLGNEYILGRGIIDQLRVTFDRGRRIIVES